jgi:hypothetical protein
MRSISFDRRALYVAKKRPSLVGDGLFRVALRLELDTR